MNNTVQHRFYEVRDSKPIVGRYLPIIFIRTIFKKLLKYVRPPLSGYSDARLLNAIRHGDQEAFEAVFERYWASLFDCVFERVQSREITQQIVQDVFVSLWLKRELLSANNLRSYLYEDAIAKSLNDLTEPFENSLEKKVTRKKLLDRNESEYDRYRRELKKV